MKQEANRGAILVDHPLIRTNLTCLRDKKTPARDFRRCLHDLTLIMVCEATRNLPVRQRKIKSPLGECPGFFPAKPVVVVPILRAALGMAEAVLEILPHASVGHIGIYRDEKTHRPRSYFSKFPGNLPDACVFLVDPMLATGQSAAAAVDFLKKAGAREILFLCVVSCPEGIERLTSAHPDVLVFTAAVDSRLNENAFIVPGLGDAGDRYFGTV